MKIQSYSALRNIVHASLVLSMAAVPSLSSAQRAGPTGDIPKFVENGPKVGEQLPDLTIFDDMGTPVNIRDITKGSYSVLVLGCLT